MTSYYNSLSLHQIMGNATIYFQVLHLEVLITGNINDENSVKFTSYFHFMTTNTFDQIYTKRTAPPILFVYTGTKDFLLIT